MHKTYKEAELSKQFPEAYKYMQYLMKKHGIKREKLQKRAHELREKVESLEKIPQKEYREIKVTTKNHVKQWGWKKQTYPQPYDKEWKS